jgi:hypothetical protein
MKLNKLAIAVIFAGGMIGASASMASAETPFEATDCAVGYEAVLSEDGVSGTCQPVPALFEEVTTDGTCWTTEDGGNVCARGAVRDAVQEPVPLPGGCVASTANDGTIMCHDAVAYSSVPVEPVPVDATCDSSATDTCQEAVLYDAVPQDTDVTNTDCGVACESVVPMLGNEPPMFKNYSAASGNSSNDSNTLATLGILIAVLGAFGIGISKEKSLKK